jgi:hypothetical protein
MDIGSSLLVMIAVKMLLTMSIVVAASFLVERSGPFLGAMIATLPISAGPSYVFLAMDHGAAFIAESAVVTIVTNGVNGLFVTAYALMAQRFSVVPSLLSGLAVWFAAIGLAHLVTWDMPSAIVLNVSCFAFASWMTRHLDADETVRTGVRSRWDVPARAIGVMCLVGFVMFAGFWLGPEAAGYAAPFPIVLSSLIVILHKRIGGRGTAVTLVHTLPGLLGFGVAVVVMHQTAVAWGSALSLSVALVICIVWNLGLMGLKRLRSEAG